ncbi:glycosyltransferase [Chloroflexota bacterium]
MNKNNAQPPTPIFSVAICTYNRADLLPGILDDLTKQNTPIETYEVLIIDNNSSDQSATIAQQYCAEHANSRYIFEAKQGLSHARNRAWQEAQGVYLAYTDDDCRIPTDWLATAQIITEQYNPVIFGGPYQAFYIDRPIWVKDSYWSSLGRVESAGWLPNNRYLSGGNLFIKKSILIELQGFTPELGVYGKKKYFGEETDFEIRVRKTYPDLKFYYDPALCVGHLVDPQKLNIRIRLHHVFRHGRSNAHLTRTHNSLENLPIMHKLKMLLLLSFHAIRTIIVILWMMSIGTLLRNRHQSPYWQNYWHEKIGDQVTTLGTIYEKTSYFSSSIIEKLTRDR